MGGPLRNNTSERLVNLSSDAVTELAPLEVVLLVVLDESKLDELRVDRDRWECHNDEEGERANPPPAVVAVVLVVEMLLLGDERDVGGSPNCCDKLDG